jgi:hypothetical protein
LGLAMTRAISCCTDLRTGGELIALLAIKDKDRPLRRPSSKD